MNRNYGIDLLRIICMYMIVVLHLLGSADIVEYLPLCSLEYEVVWLVEMLAFYAVNCYALISGYVYVNKKREFTGIIMLWFQVLFYSVFLTIVFFIYAPDRMDIRILVSSFFPVMTDQYWYFTAYVLLYLIMPILYIGIEKLSKEELKRILVIGFILFSIIPMFTEKDVFATLDGYSALWLSYLFVLGAYIKKYNVLSKVSTKNLLIIFGMCVMGTMGLKFFIEYISWNYLEVLTINTSFTKYTSPNVVLEAVIMLVLFLRVNIGEKYEKLIKKVAPLSFGVYLIHTHKLILEEFLFGQLAWFSQFSIVGMVVRILLTAFGIFVVCLFIDSIRLKIFAICNIRLLAEKINRKINKMI